MDSDLIDLINSDLVWCDLYNATYQNTFGSSHKSFAEEIEAKLK